MTYISILIILKIFIISLFILEIKTDGDNSLRNVHVQKKLQQKLKQEKHSKSIKSCDNIDNWNPHTKSVYFLLTSLNHDYKNDDLSSINALSPFFDSCTNQSELIEIEWRYQYFESMHCIKVELDLKNSTKFIEKAKYNYYSFSYRELGKNNKFRPRQSINENVNSLVLKNINLRPYIICVTFYKGDYLSQATINVSTDTSTSNESSTFEMGCNDYMTLFSQDKQTHDVDLCVDIDTQAHFLTDISHHGYSNAELLMVCFIVAILIALLILITITHTLIEKPKIKRFREYLHHRLHLHASDHKGSDEKHLHSAGNCSSAHSFHSNDGTNHHSSSGEIKEENHISETTSLLVPSFNNNATHRNDSKSSTVRFHLAEIVEDEEETNKDDQCNNENEAECIKSIAHLLDDKPWSSSRSNSIAHMKDHP